MVRRSMAARGAWWVAGACAVALCSVLALLWWLRIPVAYSLEATTDSVELVLGGDGVGPLFTSGLAVDSVTFEGYESLQIEGAALRPQGSSPGPSSPVPSSPVPSSPVPSSPVPSSVSAMSMATVPGVPSESGGWRLVGSERSRLRLRGEPGAGAVGVLRLPSVAAGTIVRLDVERGERRGLTIRMTPASDVELLLPVPFTVDARDPGAEGDGDESTRGRWSCAPDSTSARLSARGATMTLHVGLSGPAAWTADDRPLDALTLPSTRRTASARAVHLAIGVAHDRSLALEATDTLRIGDLRAASTLELRFDGTQGALSLRSRGRAGRLTAERGGTERNLRPPLAQIWSVGRPDS